MQNNQWNHRGPLPTKGPIDFLNNSTACQRRVLVVSASLLDSMVQVQLQAGKKLFALFSGHHIHFLQRLMTA